MKKNLYSIGIDLGGTNIKSGIVDDQGRLLLRRTEPVVKGKSAAAVVKQIAGVIEKLKKSGGRRIKSVGVGIPGIVDVTRGVVVSSPNFPKWRNEALPKKIAKLVSLPIVFDNDANMHALAEQKFGAGRGHANMVLLTLGTGIGGGLVLDNKIFHGDMGFAGEVGHLVVEPDGVKCGCGGRGCWEQYSASHLFKRNGLEPHEAAILAGKKNNKALKLWEEFACYLGVGIATLLNVLGVETFIIGGGISAAWDLFIKKARTSALDHTYAYHAARLKIKRAKLGNDAGIIGAATAAIIFR